MKRSGQRAVKRGERSAARPRGAGDEPVKGRSGAGRDVGNVEDAQADAAAELSRMIAELNEVRMRLDAIVRKLAQSAVELPTPAETVDDVERLRMRLVAKLDRIRDQLVTRLGEERIARDR